MSALKLKNQERLDVYRRLFLLNRSFTRITQLLDELAESPIYTLRELREMRGLTQEVQLEINAKLLPPLESAEQTDHAEFGKVGISDKETPRQVVRSKAQVSPVGILLTIAAVLNILVLVASLFVKPGPDWVYYSQDGMPAPCPPPHRGFFPRDCH